MQQATRAERAARVFKQFEESSLDLAPACIHLGKPLVDCFDRIRDFWLWLGGCRLAIFASVSCSSYLSILSRFALSLSLPLLLLLAFLFHFSLTFGKRILIFCDDIAPGENS